MTILVLAFWLAPSHALASFWAAPGVMGSAIDGLPILSVAGGEFLPDERAQVARLEAKRASLVRERETLESELDALSTEIVELKSRRVRGLRAEAELSRKLQASRDLSSRIDELARRQDEAADELARAVRRLTEAYDALAADVRARLEKLASAGAKVGTDEWAALLERLAVIESERRSVTDGLLDLHGGGSEVEGEAEPLLRDRSPTDDPEELRARADILRDTRDRLGRRLSELEEKEGAVRRQRELEREMDSFLAESRLFDEGDRAATRLVSPESDSRPVGGGSSDDTLASPESGHTDEGSPADGEAPPEDGDVFAGDPVEERGEDGSFDRSSMGPDTMSFVEGEGSSLFEVERITSRAEASAALDDLLDHDAGSSLEDIEAHRKEIERLIRRLEQRAGMLEARAEEMDERR